MDVDAPRLRRRATIPRTGHLRRGRFRIEERASDETDPQAVLERPHRHDPALVRQTVERHTERLRRFAPLDGTTDAGNSLGDEGIDALREQSVFGLDPIDPRPDARRTVCLVLHSRFTFWFLILCQPPNWCCERARSLTRLIRERAL